jgi:hypothetical protein
MARLAKEGRSTRPLHSRLSKPSKHIPSSYLHKCPRDYVSSSASQLTTCNENANSFDPHPPKLHTLGWLEYHLPNGTVYYVHLADKMTTEINLRSERMLTGVERFLADYSEDQSGSVMEGTLDSCSEIWLRDVGTELILERWWVDHRLRTVVIGGDENEHARKGSGRGNSKKGGTTVFSEEDREFCFS